MKPFATTRLADVGPALVVLVTGAMFIAFDARTGTRGSHKLWQALVLAENAVAVLWRRRHPRIALAGVLATYFLFDYQPVVLLPLAITLATVVITQPRRTALPASLVAAALVVVTPVLHDQRFNLPHQSFATLLATAIGLASGFVLLRLTRVPPVSSAR